MNLITGMIKLLNKPIEIWMNINRFLITFNLFENENINNFIAILLILLFSFLCLCILVCTVFITFKAFDIIFNWSNKKYLHSKKVKTIKRIKKFIYATLNAEQKNNSYKGWEQK